jgi:hypothetical protein
MIGAHVPLQNFNVVRPADLANQVAHLGAHVAAQHRLAIRREKHEMVVQRIHGMGGSPRLAHGRPSYRKPPEGVA